MTYFIFTIIVTSVYSVIIFSFLIGWIKIKRYKRGQTGPSLVFTSVVIAVKNEEKNIPDLLKSLASQTIQISKYEIIIVNDHSTDGTENLIRKKNQLPNLRLLNLPDGQNGKKRALQFGINSSKGSLVITTDADCTHHEQWLETITSFYGKHQPKLIIAPVLMKSKNHFEHMQALDFFSLMVSGAGASGIKRPIMCNGANLAFEKKTFQELTDPHNLSQSSGDDVFMLLNLKKKYSGEIRFLKSRKVLVFTGTEKTFSQLMKQRRRWASKSTGYKDADIILVAIVVFLTNLLMAFNLVAGIFIHELLFAFGIQLIVKSVFDYCFLFPASKFFKSTKLLCYFIPTQLANIFLVPYIALMGILMPINWKN